MKHNMLSPDIIISDATPYVQDNGFKKFSKGWYLSQVQLALSELAYDTDFDMKEWTAPVPNSRILDLPEDYWSADAMFLFDGDDCRAGNVTNIYHARGFSVYAGTNMKMQRGMQHDPVMDSVTSRASQLHYYNITDGKIYLSEACMGRNLYIKYRGTGVAIGEAPFVPVAFRRAVSLFLVVNALTILYSEDPQRWAGPLANAKDELHGGSRSRVDDGAWLLAKRRAKQFSKKERRDVTSYQANHILKQ